MKKVMDKYTEQISKICSRAYTKQQGQLTPAQNKGMACSNSTEPYQWRTQRHTWQEPTFQSKENNNGNGTSSESVQR